MQLNCEIVANLELDGNCFYYENFNFFFFAKINNSCRWWMEGGVDWIIGRFVGKVRDSNGSMVNLELTSVTVPCYNFTVTVEWNEVKK